MDIFSIVNDFSKKNYTVDSIKPVDNSHKINGSNLNFKNQDEEVDKKKIKEALDELNRELQKTLNTSLEFKFDDKTDELVVQVIDKKDDKVIREFPPKEALKIMEKMRELVGMLFDKKG